MQQSQNRITGIGFFLVILFTVLSISQAHAAEPRYQLTDTAGQPVQINGVNKKREDNTLILYTPEYGNTTRTNGFGVEAVALPIPNRPNLYQVTEIRSVWDCQKKDLSATVKACGNITIPKRGVVLSAAGGSRDILVKQFQEGAQFNLIKLLSFQNRTTIQAVNPTAETNRAGLGFPGFRGGNQMIVYNAGYGQATTGTNEFGYEVTVRNSRVVVQEGANSSIPTEAGGFVLSGHGAARNWLLENAPVGANITVTGNQLVSVVDKETYIYQLQQVRDRIKTLNPSAVTPELEARLNNLKMRSATLSEVELAKETSELKLVMTPLLWRSYPAAPETAIKGLWHRPSEPDVAAIRQTLNLMQEAGVNTIFLETYLHGNPIFPSETFTKYGIKQTPAFKGGKVETDLLALWLKEAHARGMKVHLWFQTFYAGNKQFDGTPGEIIRKYPSWANIQRSALNKPGMTPSTLEAGAFFLDPANPDVEKFLLDLIHEVVARYPVDGFQLDYIRYPSSFPPDKYSYADTTWGYTTLARNLFKARWNVDPATIDPNIDPVLWSEWNAFKTRQIDRFVDKAHKIIKQTRDVRISAAVFPKPEDSLIRKHQNWPEWAKQGWVDFLAPMTLTSSQDVVAIDTRTVKALTGLPVATGIFGPFNGNDPSDIVAQVWAAQSNGSSGSILFDTAHLTVQAARALNAGIFGKPPAVKK